jgi:D-threonate/D-erythronate kinase
VPSWVPVTDKIHTLGLIADDLTGANDTAVQFARRGWETLLILCERGQSPVPIRASGPKVFALTTDARALDNASAEKVTADAVRQLMNVGVDHIYLKIDSTMRGSVSGQIAGAISAWRSQHANAFAVVCPAYPRMGRTVVANHVLVSGQPVQHSAIGRDPVTPVTTSDLARLLPSSARARAEDLAHVSSSIVTVDAESTGDLANLASAIIAAGPSSIPVGSAGLADAIAAAAAEHAQSHAIPRATDIERNPRILIQVTSLNPVSHAQVAMLKQVFPDVVLLTAPAERVGDSSAAETVAAAFADRVAHESWDVLGMIGGDGARAALRRLDASAIRICDAVVEGIPRGIIIGGEADGMTIFTKAGGFGAEDALVRVVEKLKT